MNVWIIHCKINFTVWHMLKKQKEMFDKLSLPYQHINQTRSKNKCVKMSKLEFFFYVMATAILPLIGQSTE